MIDGGTKFVSAWGLQEKKYISIIIIDNYRQKQYYYTPISLATVAIDSVHVVVLEDTQVFFLFVICFSSFCCFILLVLLLFFVLFQFSFVLVLIQAFVLQLVLLQFLLYSYHCTISCSPCSSSWTYCYFLLYLFSSLIFLLLQFLLFFQAHFLFST